jgi:3-methyladenine DNA glycosylase AlkD
MENNTDIENLREALRQQSSEKTKESAQRFFKDEVKFYGVKSADIHKISKIHFKQMENPTKEKIFAMCEMLWQSGLMEESIVACNWSYQMRKFYEPKDFYIFEKWINLYVTNWAACDTFCNHTVGTLIEKHPQFLQNLKSWAMSSNRWMRRAAAVSLIVPAKKGEFLPEIFEIANLMLLDTDDMVQKGYGWMLKVSCQHHEKKVFDFVMLNKKNMPRTALRYAIEKMPEEKRKKAMER